MMDLFQQFRRTNDHRGPVVFRRLALLTAVSCFLPAMRANAAGEGTYLEDLSPVVYLQLDPAPSASVSLAEGFVLTKSASFPGDYPTAVAGPNSWAGGGWDFSACDGGYLLDVDSSTLASVGEIDATDGLSVSFWARGSYAGRTSRIMAGSFDIGTSKTGVWGGTRDYQTVSSPANLQAWDGAWHHFAVTVDFTSFVDSIKLYQDGGLVGTRDGIYVSDVNIEPPPARSLSLPPAVRSRPTSKAITCQEK